MAGLKVSVVSAEKEVWTGEAKQVVARTMIGQIGILRGHEPVLAILDSGEVRVTLEDGTIVTVSAEDGFLSVEHDMVTVVARNAELVHAVAVASGVQLSFNYTLRTENSTPRLPTRRKIVMPSACCNNSGSVMPRFLCQHDRRAFQRNWLSLLPRRL